MWNLLTLTQFRIISEHCYSFGHFHMSKNPGTTKTPGEVCLDHKEAGGSGGCGIGWGFAVLGMDGGGCIWGYACWICQLLDN